MGMGMGMGKLSAFAGVAGSVALAGSAEAALQSLSMDLIRSGTEGNTYHLLANVDPGDVVDAVFADSQNSLLIDTANGASFYQNANGGPTSLSINSNFFVFVPSLEWDSYVTIGSLDQSGTPFPSNQLGEAFIDWNNFESGGGIDLTSGVWNIIGGAVGAPQAEEISGQVLLGQFTVQGGNGDASDLIGQINVQGFDSGGSGWTTYGASWSTAVVPEPSTALLIGLGLSGLAAKGRRRNRS